MAKTIIVTGAGSGIGASTTKIFLDAGWNVGLIGRREGPLVEVSKGHANALVLPCDVTDEVSVEAAFNEIVAKFGHLDVLFNNAGVGVPASSIDECRCVAAMFGYKPNWKFPLRSCCMADHA